MDINESDKVNVLINRLDFHTNEIHRKQSTEVNLFEWSSALLLAIFAGVIALGGQKPQFTHPEVMKVIATVLIIVPTAVFSYRILDERAGMGRQAAMIERIENELQLFDVGVYLADSAVYPAGWRGALARKMLRRKTPWIYMSMLVFMCACVVTALWIVL